MPSTCADHTENSRLSDISLAALYLSVSHRWFKQRAPMSEFAVRPLLIVLLRRLQLSSVCRCAIYMFAHGEKISCD